MRVLAEGAKLPTPLPAEAPIPRTVGAGVARWLTEQAGEHRLGSGSTPCRPLAMAAAGLSAGAAAGNAARTAGTGRRPNPQSDWRLSAAAWVREPGTADPHPRRAASASRHH